MSMVITVLGSGTCVPTVPSLGHRHPPGFLVRYGNASMLLFECSQGIYDRLEQIDVNPVDVTQIAISHAHPDHYAFPHFLLAIKVKPFWVAGQAASRGIRVYCPDQIRSSFLALWNAHFPESQEALRPMLAGYGASVGWPNLSFFATDQDRDTRVFDLDEGALLQTFQAYHGFGKTPALCFRLMVDRKVIAFSGDTGDCAGVRAAAADADLFICECSARVGDDEAPRVYGHLNPRVMGDIARAARVKRLVVFHHSGLDSSADIERECRRAGFRGEFQMASDFLELKV